MPVLGRRTLEVSAVQVGAAAVAEPPSAWEDRGRGQNSEQRTEPRGAAASYWCMKPTRQVLGAVGIALPVVVLVLGGEGNAGGGVGAQ